MKVNQKNKFQKIIKFLLSINIIILILGFIYLNQNINEEKVELIQELDLYQKEKEILENTISLQETKTENLKKNITVLIGKINIVREEIENTNTINEEKLTLEKKIIELKEKEKTLQDKIIQLNSEIKSLDLTEEEYEAITRSS